MKTYLSGSAWFSQVRAKAPDAAARKKLTTENFMVNVLVMILVLMMIVVLISMGFLGKMKPRVQRFQSH